MNDQTEIVPADTDSDEELGLVISTLVISFATDPVARWLYDGNASLYLQRMPVLFAALARDCARAKTIFRTVDRTGVALWLPPGAAADEAAVAHALTTTIPQHLQDDAGHLFEWTDRHRPTEPFWYLSLVGVEPSARGKGNAAALIETALRRVDADHAPAYLWSSNPALNTSLYLRHGFEVIDEGRFGSSPPISAMLRPAR